MKHLYDLSTVNVLIHTLSTTAMYVYPKTSTFILSEFNNLLYHSWDAIFRICEAFQLEWLQWNDTQRGQIPIEKKDQKSIFYACT